MESICDQVNIDISLMVVGDSGVGKTSLIRKYAHNKFEDNYISTIGIDFTTQYMAISLPSERCFVQKNVRFKIFDIGGQNHYHDRIKQRAEFCNVYIMCYDITNRESYFHMQKWYDLIYDARRSLYEERGVLTPYQIIATATKHDLSTDIHNRSAYNHVKLEELQHVVSSLKLDYGIETLAKTGDNVQFMFQTALRYAFNTHTLLNLTREFPSLSFQELQQNPRYYAKINETYFKKYTYYPCFFPIVSNIAPLTANYCFKTIIE